MRIEMAHIQEQGINFAVFNADATNHTDAGRQALLGRLIIAAQRNRLRVEKAALAFEEGGQIKYFGTPDLVRFLAPRGVPRWTHTLNV